MKNYDNPKLFRYEADSRVRVALSHQFLKPYLDSYNIHMAKYFLSAEYECRKKALYFKKKIQSCQLYNVYKKTPYKNINIRKILICIDISRDVC